MKTQGFGNWLGRLWPLLIPPMLYFFADRAWPVAAAGALDPNSKGDGTILLRLGQAATFGSPLVVLGLFVAKFICRTTWEAFALWSTVVMASAVAFFAGCETGRVKASAVRKEVFRQLAVRSEPMVAAVENFILLRNRPPANWAELVPHSLPAELTTGTGRYPRFTVLDRNETNRWRYGSNSWAIRLYLSDCGKWDEFFFVPTQNYRDLGTSVEPVGRWALRGSD